MSHAIVRATDCLSVFRFFKKENPHDLTRNKFIISSANKRNLFFRTLRCGQKSDPSLRFTVFGSAMLETPLDTSVELVSVRLQLLVSEFKSLKEPIDRVTRLLHYAGILPPFDESARVPENRVTGCTTEVWLEAKMDRNRRMRFQADSDSEITKGFLSCLIWLMNGAQPEEVAVLRGEDLAEMNVGVHGRVQSRVNTWDNVLVSMKERTKALVAAQEAERTMEAFPPLLLSADGVVSSSNQSCAQVPVDELPLVPLT